MMAAAKEKTVTTSLWKRTHINTKRKQQDLCQMQIKSSCEFSWKKAQTEGVPGLTAVIGTVRSVV